MPHRSSHLARALSAVDGMRVGLCGNFPIFVSAESTREHCRPAWNQVRGPHFAVRLIAARRIPPCYIFPCPVRPPNAMCVCSGRAWAVRLHSNARSTTVCIWSNHQRAPGDRRVRMLRQDFTLLSCSKPISICLSFMRALCAPGSDNGGEWAKTNSKSQISNLKQVPKANSKIPNATREYVRGLIGVWNLDLVWDLGFGIWNFPAEAASPQPPPALPPAPAVLRAR